MIWGFDNFICVVYPVICSTLGGEYCVITVGLFWRKLLRHKNCESDDDRYVMGTFPYTRGGGGRGRLKQQLCNFEILVGSHNCQDVEHVMVPCVLKDPPTEGWVEN